MRGLSNADSGNIVLTIAQRIVENRAYLSDIDGLIDAFAPGLQAFSAMTAKRDDFAAALDALIVAADKGRDSTVDLVAKIGRAARLGERSRGVLDPGAASCAIILRSLAEGVKAKLDTLNPRQSREAPA